MIADNPFREYPEFSKVMDDISRDGFQLHYQSMRVLYADDGVKWRRKWEPLILKWKRLSETWTQIVGIIRSHRYDDLTIMRNILNNVSDVEVSEFFTRMYNNLKSYQEIEGLKRYLITKSKSESKSIRDFLETNLEQYSYYDERAILFSENQAVVFKNAILDFLECMETVKPMVNMGGIKMVPYDDYMNFVFSLKEIMENVDIKPC